MYFASNNYIIFEFYCNCFADKRFEKRKEQHPLVRDPPIPLLSLSLSLSLKKESQVHLVGLPTITIIGSKKEMQGMCANSLCFYIPREIALVQLSI